MPTYFFDLIKGNQLVEDDQGEDCAEIEAAKLEGLASARELLADAAKKGILATSPVYLIRNAAGDILATLGSRLFRYCVSYMLARLRQRLAQPRDRSICRPQIVEVAVPHQFGLAERSCACEDGLTSALLHIRHLPLQFGDAPVRIYERPVVQLSVAH